MPAALLGGAISGGASILSGIMGNNAAQNAAKLQSQADKQASTIAGNAGATAANAENQQIAGEATNAAPYTSLGNTAATELNSDLAPGGSLTQGWNQTFSAPTAAQAEATPGYQFQLQQGQDALQNSAAARGGLLSTGTAKALDAYSQGLASTNYQNAYNNALQTYGTNFNTFETNQNNLYNRLSGATSTGLNAVNNLNSVQQGGTNALQSGLLETAQLQGNDLMGAGQAQAAGVVGGTNALTAGLTGGANALGQGLTLQGILGAQNASNTTAPNTAYHDPNTGPAYA